MEAVMARLQMNCHLLTFRMGTKAKDSKETATTAARHGTRVRIIEHPRRRKETRTSTILRETKTRNTRITAIVMGILRPSASENLGILDIRSSRLRMETKKQEMLRFSH